MVSMRWVAWIALALAAGSGVDAAAQHDPPKPPEPKYTRQSAFKIPFEYAPAPDGQRALEVQLHVKLDGGAWYKAQTVSPREKAFPFRAPHDGRYGFMPLVKYPDNKLAPEGPPTPQLVVVVDTVRPMLELTAERADGAIRVGWRVSDPNLKPESFKVEYQLVAAGANWQRVAVDPLPSAADGQDEPLGETMLVPQGQADRVAIRAEVADKAGNRTVSERLVEMRAPPSRAKAGAERTFDAAEDSTPPHMAERFPTSEPDELDADAGRTVGPPDAAATGRFASRRAAPRAARGPTPSVPASYPDTGPDDDDESDDEMSPRSQVPGAKPKAGPNSQGPARNEKPMGLGPGSLDPRRQPVREEVSPPSGRRGPETQVERDDPSQAFQGELLPPAAEPRLAKRAADAGPTDDALPPGAQPHLVNKESFELDYELEDIGSSGVAKVELWMTRDGGRTWSLFGADDDSRSPMTVAVEGEGTYGFRMVVESGSGLRGKPPQSGESPDIWVGVDLTPPTASFVSTEQSSVDGVDELVIGWEAGDDPLAERPITLSFRPSTDGPWTTVAADLENSGKFTWRIDPRVPDQVYLRLEARDEAGNVRTVDSPEPVVILRSRPRGRIREVRPKNDSSVKPKMIHNMR